jgi:hypothetical protein
VTSGIFLVQDGQLVEMHEVPYELEDVLQRLLVDYPDLLPGNQIDRVMPRKCVLVAREQSLRFEEGGPLRWRVDHIFLDQDGIPTLVEVKHSTGPSHSSRGCGADARLHRRRGRLLARTNRSNSKQ